MRGQRDASLNAWTGPTPSAKISGMNHSQIVSFIWGVADLIRDTFRRGKYQDVILPLTVMRRLDFVLAPTKAEVLATKSKLKGQLENLDPQLRKASGYAFYNTSLYDFPKLKDDAPNIASNLRNYIAGFSPNMREVLEKFDFDNTIAKLDEAGMLFQVIEEFCDQKLNLHPDAIDNFTMGTIFEELIRKFNEALNENPGEHFTPRDVVHLMVDLMLAGDEDRLSRKGAVLSIYDPCCGSGGMLTIAKEHIAVGEIRGDEVEHGAVNEGADIHLFGQEVNPETWAVAKSDLYMKSADGRDAEGIAYGSVLSNDRHSGTAFDYMIANPPYGKDWKRDKNAVEEEHESTGGGRFGPGLPRISDGQLLFMMHMVAHMKPAEDGGSRIALIMNGSPLFTGDAGSGESEIRRWAMESDLVEAIVALPEQLFYNTGIATYVWVITNRKRADREGSVLLVDASQFDQKQRKGLFSTQLRKTLGSKRREIPVGAKTEILDLIDAFEDGQTRTLTENGEEREVTVTHVFPTTHFGFRKITVERPLRLDFRASPERIERLKEERAFQNLAVSRKRGAAKAADEKAGAALQAEVLEMLAGLPDDVFTDRAEFLPVLDGAAKAAGLKLAAPVKKAILSALSERNAEAAVCVDKNGDPEPDTDLRDTENVPLGEDVEAYFEREVLPHVPDAWIDTSKRDPKDGEVGLVGYEINFNREFYEYRPPRPLEEIQADIRELEVEIVQLLRDVAG